MKKNKAVLSLLLSLVMVFSTLVACDGDTTDETTSAATSAPAATTTAPEEETTEPETEEPTESEETEEPTESETVTEEPTESETEEPTTEPGPALNYEGEITLMHFSTLEESQGNGGSEGFRTLISEWKEANPDITLNETVLANDEFKTQIATLAGAGDMPDIFLLQGMNTKAWAAQDLILDMTDIINDSPYADQYIDSYFTPFTDGDKIYGLPVLTGGTCTVVLYDQRAWAEAGFDTFPETWAEVEEANDYFLDNGYREAIAFGNSGKWQMNSCFLSVAGDRFTGPEWFTSLMNKEGASFTDDAFVQALEFTGEIFQSGVFNDDFNAISNEDAREYFIAGDTPAFIGGNWDVQYIGATLQETDMEFYENTKFAVLPQPEGATGSTNTQNIGLGYAVAFSTEITDPAKLAAATDFAYKVTGPEFATFVAEGYALGGLTAVDEVDLSKFDQYTQDFYNYSYVDTVPCEIYDSYIDPAVWDVLNTELQNLTNGNTDAATVAQLTQDSYEANYK